MKELQRCVYVRNTNIIGLTVTVQIMLSGNIGTSPQKLRDPISKQRKLSYSSVEHSSRALIN